MNYCSELGKGETRKYLFRATNMWWSCAHYFVIASCGLMPRENRCMYMAHVCFMSVVVTDSLRDCGNFCCVAIVEYSVFFSLGVLKYVCVRGVWDVVFLIVL